MTKLEKLEKKYGDPFLKNIAEKTEVTQGYYELWLECQQEERRSRIRALLAYTAAASFFLLAYFAQAPALQIFSLTLFCLAVQSYCDARIERLWSAKFTNNIFAAIRFYRLEKTVGKLKKEVEDDR